MIYDLRIGIDHLGAKTPVSRSAALQVYQSRCGEEPQSVLSPASTDGSRRNWCRREIANWLADRVRHNTLFIAGIDHGFSFPISYFERHGIKTWDQFLIDFTLHWPTDQDKIHVDALRQQSHGPASKRTGSNKEFRLTEKWSSSAKSVFKFDVQGTVAKSKHAGIPWLLRIRNDFGDRVHFWPFDGWIPLKGKSVIAEIYPSIFRNRFLRQQRSSDQQDAYSVARWLSTTSQTGFLDRYFNPPLTDHERETAVLEG